MSSRTRRNCLVASGLVLLLLVMAAGVVIYFVVAAARRVGNDLDSLNSDTSATFRPRVAAGRVEFEMTYGKDVTNLSVFTVTDADGQKLWEVQGHGTDRPPVVVYGELPAGAEGRKQVFPEGGARPADVRGKRVRVDVGVRFVTGFGAGHQTYSGEFDIPKGP